MMTAAGTPGENRDDGFDPRAPRIRSTGPDSWELKRGIGPDPAGPTLRIKFSDLLGAARVELVEITPAPGGRAITRADLESVHLSTETEYARRAAAFWKRAFPSPAAAAERAVAVGHPVPGTAISREHLEAVADVYLTAPLHRGSRAIEDQWNVSHSTAARWVSLAREHGIIPPRRMPK